MPLLKFNFDYLCAGRTAPNHSWRNPVERIMLILNLGLQCVGLACSEMSAEFEAVVKKCNCLAELQQQVASYKDKLNDSPLLKLAYILYSADFNFIRTLKYTTRLLMMK